MNNNNAQQPNESDNEDDISWKDYKPVGFPGIFSSPDVKEQQPKFSSVKIHHPISDFGVRDQQMSRSMPSRLEAPYRKQSSKTSDNVYPKDLKSKDLQKNLNHSKWSVAENSMEVLTEDFPLERTSRHFPDSDASEISSRICECLRERSVQANYNNKKAKAKCVSMENVKFRIQLFSSESGGVTVEVQRRRGDGVAFMRECRAVLNAAAGNGSTLDEPRSLGSVSELKCIRNATNVSPPDAQSEVARVEKMLSDCKEDTSLHALELLRDMCDPVKSSAIIVEAVSRRVFDKKSDTCSHLLRILQSSAEDITSRTEEGNSWTAFKYQLVLNVMANALSVMHDSDQFSIICQDRSMNRIVVPILLKLVTVGRVYPHISFFAIKCVSFLASDHRVRLDLLEADVISSLIDAADLGLESHENLATMAENTLLKCSH